MVSQRGDFAYALLCRGAHDLVGTVRSSGAHKRLPPLLRPPARIGLIVSSLGSLPMKPIAQEP
jgi:hypothetical protein